MEKLKIKEVRRDTKERIKDSVKDKVTQAGIRTKDKVVHETGEKVQQAISPKKDKGQTSQSPESYASEQVSDTAEKTAEEAVSLSERAVVKGISTGRRKIQEKRAEKKDQTASDQTDIPVDSSEPMPSEQIPELTAEGNAPDVIANQNTGTTLCTEVKASENIVKQKPENIGQTESISPNVAAEKSVKTPGREDTIRDTKLPEKKEATPASPIDKKGKADVIDTVPSSEQTPEKTVKTKTQSAPRSREKQTPINGTSKQRKVKHFAGEADKTIKTTNRSAEIGKRSIKTAEDTLKTAEKSAETIKKTAEATAKTTKRTVKATEKASKAAIEGVQALVKALAELGKAAAAGVKSIGALAAGGGGVTVLIIIICVLIAAIAGTFIGIFLTNDESTGSEMTMNSAVSQLTSEYFASLTDFESGYTYDTIEVNGDMSINWKEVIAVYAVQSTNGTEGAFEVATLNADKVNVMKTILLDMCSFTGNVTTFPEISATISTDANGNSVVSYTTVNKQKLTVTVTKKTPMQYAEDKGFSAEAKAQLQELLGGEYDELWDELLAGVVTVLQTNSTWKPTSIFCWPLQNESYISSHFGTRVDPISGEIKTHNGIDIPAALGTPILAAADGIVNVPPFNAGGYGNYVILTHNGGFQTVYGHCSSVLVSTGQHVVQGQVIALVGSTGYSTGPHLHYEVRVNGVRTDPLSYYSAN